MLIGINQKITRNNTNINQQKPTFSVTPNKPITENHRICNLPSTYYNHPNISFLGKYDPTHKEIAQITHALKGWPGERIKGPNYFASPKIVQELYAFIHSGKNLDNETIFSISQKRAQAHNNFVLTKINAPIKSSQDFLPETQKFVQELKTETTTTQKTLCGLGLNKAEIKLFNKFAATTASTLFQMGYPDAIAHSSQVARKCAIEASLKTKDSTEILKSAMVGWLHDPKFPANISFSNLAAHPVIAGAISTEILDSKEFQISLTHLLSSSAKAKSFAHGINESLLINNDSEYVMSNVILHKRSFSPQNGLADVAPEAEPIIRQRFLAPSKGELPQEVSFQTLKTLHKMPFETGILGINLDSLQKACSELSSNFKEAKAKTPEEIHNGILSGKIKNSDFVNALRQKLQSDPKGIENHRIPGSTLLCHHLETSQDGRIPAATLIVADPMLLSPHKIILGNVESFNPVGRIESFLKSIDDNVNALPKDNQPKGKVWQKELLVSMANAADELSGRPNTDHLKKSIEELSQNLKEPQSWGEYSSLDLKLLENTPKITQMTDVIKRHYDHAASNSENMFKVK